MKTGSNRLTWALFLALATGLLTPVRADDSAQLLEKVKAELNQRQVTEPTLNAVQALVIAQPQNSQAHLYLGLILDQLGLNEPAAEQFELAVRFGADNPDALVELCKQEIKLGRIETAVALLNEGLKKFPRNAEMMYLVGDYLLTNKQVLDARVVLERAFRLDKDRKLFGLPTALGESLLDLRTDVSADLASIDLSRKPDFRRGHFVRGFAYRRLGRYDKAALDLQFAFEKGPLSPVVCEALSECYFFQGDYEAALRPALFLSALTAIDDSEPSGSLQKLVRVMVKVPRNKVLDLVTRVEKELKLRGVLRPAVFYVIGKAFDQLDMPAAAMWEYRQALELDPNCVRAYFRLALDQELYLRDYESALANYETAYNLRPWDHEIELAYLRLRDRLHNRKSDVAWRWKDWLAKTFNIN